MNEHMESISVVIAVETCIYREGISHLLVQHPNIEIENKVSNYEDAFDACGVLIEKSHAQVDDLGEHNQKILLLDATISGALELVSAINQHFPDIRIVMLSMRASKEDMSVFAANGSMEFVSREDSVEDLLHCIDAAINNGFWCSNRLAKLLLKEEPMQTSTHSHSLFDDDLGILTRRQTKVLNLLGTGLSNKEIARSLNIETNTVKNHVHQILQKLHVSTRREAAAKIQKGSRDQFN